MQLISHEGKLFGLSTNGRIYEFTRNEEGDSNWTFRSESPKYASPQEEEQEKLIKKSLEEFAKTSQGKAKMKKVLE